MKQFDEMVRMKFGCVVVFVVDRLVFALVDDSPDILNLVLQLVKYLDNLYLDAIHLPVDEHLVNKTITNKLNHTIKQNLF
jgi:hypothetical protein